MNRRAFLNGTLGAALTASTPIIDTHIHLFDTARPQGVPWPDKANTTLFQPALPPRLRRIAAPFGVTGAIAIECSPWLEDNQWLLDTAARDSFILGAVGNLEPGQPAFRAQLERFRRNPLFLGIRYGNLWGRDLSTAVRRPDVIADLKALAQAGLALDTANPNPSLIDAVLELTTRVPDLRVVIDHLPQMEPNAQVRELARHPRVFVKGSAVLRRVEGKVPTNPAFYKPRLDELFELFGPNRLLYGSDWPNSDQWGSYAQVWNVVHAYFSAKGADVAGKYFWRNAEAAYRWPSK